MQQLALDIGLVYAPSLTNFFIGNNAEVHRHLSLWLGAPGANALARSALPTYLWGVSGSGKSHLLRALQSALQARGERVGWLDPTVAEPPEFDPHWSALLMDDVQTLNIGQQQCAFSWFINGQTHQRAVLAAATLPAADLPLREDLRSRLAWGHVFALQAPDEAQRRAVLRASAQARGLLLSEDVITFILTRFSRDLGSLIGLLDLLDRYALQTQRGVTIPLIKLMLDQA